MGIAKTKYEALDLDRAQIEALRAHLVNALLDRQQADGHWHYPLDDNITMNSEQIFFLFWMDEDRPELVSRLAQFILEKQLEDGSWNIYHGGPGNLSASIEAYFALRLAGYSPSEPALIRAKNFIVNNGGIPKCRVFTRIWLALFEQYPFEGIPMIPPEIMLAPRATPFNIYEFSYWSRTVVIPLTILFHLQRTKEVNFNLDELYPTAASKQDLDYAPVVPVDETWMLRPKLWQSGWINWTQVFTTINHGVTLYENKAPVKPLRKLALDKARDWILDHQDESGDWGGILPAMQNSLMALYALGYEKDSPAIAKGLEALDRLTRGLSSSISPHATEVGSTATIQSCVSPIWDSALAALGLIESGVDPKDPRLQKTREWLWENRITQRGDWNLKAKIPAQQDFAAWCFQYHNSFYPDTDDTTVSTLTLFKLGMSLEELKPCLNWLFAMQNSDGGWGTFDKDNTQWILNEIPFADLKSLIDPSNPDCTGHVLETLGELGLGNSRSAKRAIRYLKRSQRPCGSWFGRWGVHTIYGTCAAVVGLRKCGEPVDAAYIQRAIRFVLSTQNEDGGWGESCDNYSPHVDTGVGNSTPSQTAWALMSLQACQKSSSDFSEEIGRATDFLASRKQNDGLYEPEFTGTGFPMHFYLRYDGYRNYFPAIALGRLSK